jgi:chorismate synthase
MTVGLVAAGVIAKKMMPELRFATRIAEVGGCGDPALFGEIIAAAKAQGDSVGGIVETVVEGIPAGVGNPLFDSVESVVSHLLFAVPAVKGVEFGAGFEAARRRGSENNDLITDSSGTTSTNNDGGVNGGIANGNPLVVRAAIKPTPSIAKPQATFDFGSGGIRELSIMGRHDVCIALRAVVVIEAAIAVALAEFL